MGALIDALVDVIKGTWPQPPPLLSYTLAGVARNAPRALVSDFFVSRATEFLPRLAAAAEAGTHARAAGAVTALVLMSLRTAAALTSSPLPQLVGHLYMLDAAGPRVWVDLPGTAPLIAQLKGAFRDHESVPPDSPNAAARLAAFSRGAFPDRAALTALRATVLPILHALPPDGHMLDILPSLVGYAAARDLAVKHLSSWLASTWTSRAAEELLASLVDHTTGAAPADRAVVAALVRLRPGKSDELLARLIAAHEPRIRIHVLGALLEAAAAAGKPSSRLASMAAVFETVTTPNAEYELGTVAAALLMQPKFRRGVPAFLRAFWAAGVVVGPHPPSSAPRPPRPPFDMVGFVAGATARPAAWPKPDSGFDIAAWVKTLVDLLVAAILASVPHAVHDPATKPAAWPPADAFPRAVPRIHAIAAKWLTLNIPSVFPQLSERDLTSYLTRILLLAPAKAYSVPELSPAATARLVKYALRTVPLEQECLVSICRCRGLAPPTRLAFALKILRRAASLPPPRPPLGADEVIAALLNPATLVWPRPLASHMARAPPLARADLLWQAFVGMTLASCLAPATVGAACWENVPPVRLCMERLITGIPLPHSLPPPRPPAPSADATLARIEADAKAALASAAPGAPPLDALLHMSLVRDGALLAPRAPVDAATYTALPSAVDERLAALQTELNLSAPLTASRAPDFLRSLIARQDPSETLKWLSPLLAGDSATASAIMDSVPLPTLCQLLVTALLERASFADALATRVAAGLPAAAKPVLSVLLPGLSSPAAPRRAAASAALTAVVSDAWLTAIPAMAPGLASLLTSTLAAALRVEDRVTVLAAYLDALVALAPDNPPVVDVVVTAVADIAAGRSPVPSSALDDVLSPRPALLVAVTRMVAAASADADPAALAALLPAVQALVVLILHADDAQLLVSLVAVLAAANGGRVPRAWPVCLPLALLGPPDLPLAAAARAACSLADVVALLARPGPRAQRSALLALPVVTAASDADLAAAAASLGALSRKMLAFRLKTLSAAPTAPTAAARLLAATLARPAPASASAGAAVAAVGMDIADDGARADSSAPPTAPLVVRRLASPAPRLASATVSVDAIVARAVDSRCLSLEADVAAAEASLCGDALRAWRAELATALCTKVLPAPAVCRHPAAAGFVAWLLDAWAVPAMDAALGAGPYTDLAPGAARLLLAGCATASAWPRISAALDAITPAAPSLVQERLLMALHAVATRPGAWLSYLDANSERRRVKWELAPDRPSSLVVSPVLSDSALAALGGIVSSDRWLRLVVRLARTGRGLRAVVTGARNAGAGDAPWVTRLCLKFPDELGETAAAASPLLSPPQWSAPGLDLAASNADVVIHHLLVQLDMTAGGRAAFGALAYYARAHGAVLVRHTPSLLGMLDAMVSGGLTRPAALTMAFALIALLHALRRVLTRDLVAAVLDLLGSAFLAGAGAQAGAGHDEWLHLRRLMGLAAFVHVRLAEDAGLTVAGDDKFLAALAQLTGGWPDGGGAPWIERLLAMAHGRPLPRLRYASSRDLPTLRRQQDGDPAAAAAELDAVVAVAVGPKPDARPLAFEILFRHLSCLPEHAPAVVPHLETALRSRDRALVHAVAKQSVGLLQLVGGDGEELLRAVARRLDTASRAAVDAHFVSLMPR
ncbi:uncharacterized protein AMSG_10501 [Thecamonas trahens ATCC 50062]|uniref:Uncharacterized protein n=1 Tax=Thecamonas trahens ATCC 50062 TaxID=461836 RepID=A0A0L0DSR8_THETB|nr:hypothetical protein AMSG_10501 [Thecamonas trahens ATCC 50062]KNC54503.1 hypothetical protein AMSG_10501 [Thecamonas trahens ATCC 50062]|eukprot:XP_013753656.1 hypothetical protein AMSG_10501 [Thecamonas trahens ATCC 50062]